MQDGTYKALDSLRQDGKNCPIRTNCLTDIANIIYVDYFQSLLCLSYVLLVTTPWLFWCVYERNPAFDNFLTRPTFANKSNSSDRCLRM
jgi:hypothetical protein